MLKIALEHLGEWFAYEPDSYDGAPDSTSITGQGSTKEEAIENFLLSYESRPDPKIVDAFELDMAEKGIHKDDFPDRFFEWLEGKVEVIE